MKLTTRWIMVSMVACAICSLIMYRITYRCAFQRGYWIGARTAIGTDRFSQSLADYTALLKLRTGDVESATRMLEMYCLDSAHIYYEAPGTAGEARQWMSAKKLMYYPGPAEARDLAKGLSVYRATYRTNSADWNAMERKLAIELAKIKSDDPKAWAGIAITDTGCVVTNTAPSTLEPPAP